MLEYSRNNLDEFKQIMDEGYVILEFYAPWCGTCRSVTRMLNFLDQKHYIEIIRIDIETAKDVSIQYQVLGVPLLILCKNNQEIMRIGGSLNYEEFKSWIHQIEDFKELS